MIAENAAALRILMNDDLYLTQPDLKWENTIPFNTETAVFLPEPIIEPDIQSFGKNQKNFLILTNSVILDNHLKALESTLLRKQLTLDDIALVDFSLHQHLTFTRFDTVFMPQKLVLFGVKPEGLGFSGLVQNQIQKINSVEILYTYSFAEMLGDKEKTKAFWEPMKNL